MNWFGQNLPAQKRLFWNVAVFFAFILIFILGTAVLDSLWQERIYPNVRVANLELGGLTLAEARLRLQAVKQRLESEGQAFVLGSEQVFIYPLVTSLADPDLTYELYSPQIDQTLETAFAVGHAASGLDGLLTLYRSLLKENILPMDFVINRERLVEVLRENFSHHEILPRDAEFVFRHGQLEIIAGRSGRLIDVEHALAETTDRLVWLSAEPVKLSVSATEPATTYRDLSAVKTQAMDFINRAPFIISATYTDDYLDTNWQQTVGAETVANWLTAGHATDLAKLGFGSNLEKFLAEQAKVIDQESQDARFEVTDGKITQFQVSRAGIKLDIGSAVEILTQELLGRGQKQVALSLTPVQPKVSTGQVNDLGISEILGVGRSNFAGSPANRRHNIEVSSAKLNGLLIAPGEEFSLVEALRPFTAEAGYKPELVIKGNRLIPEVGGGACQIGTTIFRAALSAGLDISQRRNHSFAVSYYNDEHGLPGTDATIYDPAPDFRFVNNTPGHLLVQTRVNDDDSLSYELWGTNDGRQASTTKPIILARSPAPATNYIETEDLEPGETSCSGSNVPGYTTTFRYLVKLADGTYSEENFDSKYRPWQRVCLIGVEKKSVTETSELESSELVN